MKLRYESVTPGGAITHAHEGDACFDLRAAEDAVIQPGRSANIGTGCRFEIPAGFVMFVFSRSGHGFQHGVRLSNAVGVIDSGYRGEVRVSLHNDGADAFRVNAGDRIAQAMLMPVLPITIEQAEFIDIKTSRGASGFGSTGSK